MAIRGWFRKSAALPQGMLEAAPLDALTSLFGPRDSWRDPQALLGDVPAPPRAGEPPTFPASAAPAAVTSVKASCAESLAAEIERSVPYPDDPTYRAPNALCVGEIEVPRVLVIGSCFSELLTVYMGHAWPGAHCDHVTYNHAGQLPTDPPQKLENYTFQVIMLGLRSAMPEPLYWRPAYDDVDGHQEAFVTARLRVVQTLRGALAYREHREVTTFVANFLVAQQNPMGKLFPRYDLRNPVFFVEQLNRVLADEIAGMPNVHLLDIDAISANFGRRYIQDDVIWMLNHGSFVSDYDHGFDAARLEVAKPLSVTLPPRVPEFIVAVGHELRAMYRTLRQIDQVKMIIVDLDDTLWRGVVAEEGVDRPMVTEGWPAGFAEALMFARKRGIVLAIVSKNSEERIRELWSHLYGGRLELADFASVHINFDPKPVNVARVLRDTNLLPRNVVFVDDNPVERAAVAAAFPDVRLLGADPYALRRVVLWSPELQVADVSEESARRTEMIQAQIRRERAREQVPREAFLATLDIRVGLFAIRDTANPRFPRAFELLNKSNQYNTTGTRWTHDDCAAAFGRGTLFWVFDVKDRFTRYGLVGVAVVDGRAVEQFVMSCRVIGLDVEIAVLAALAQGAVGVVSGRVVPTDANLLSRDLFSRCGFEEVSGIWEKPQGHEIPMPDHVRELQREGP